MKDSKEKYKRIYPDPKFKDELVARFINNMMVDGKKSVAYKIFYEAMDVIQEKNSEETPVEIFKKAVSNVCPAVEVRSRRVGGATFQIPQEVKPNRKLSLGMKWLIKFARGRKEKSMGRKLASELLAAYNEEGGAYKKKEDTHRMAESNKAFSHFRF